MRFAYADPPYLGCAVKHYGHQHADAAAYDTIEAHAALIERLSDEFDGWALSCTSGNLWDLLPHCPRDARIGAWVKPFASFKPGVNPAYAWEPVIFRGGRKRPRTDATVRDWAAVNITLQRGVSGAKPKEFVWWVLDLLGPSLDDEVVDLFHGSGAVQAVIDEWREGRTGSFQEGLFA